jgi:hypothetical protein
MKIDITKIPVYQIKLSTLKEPYDIVRLLKRANITSFAYEFNYFNDVMKYGVQYDSNEQEPGERVYRQSFHLPGWDTRASPNSAGNDMLDIIEHFPSIDRKDVAIRIWDMTNYPRASSIDTKFEVNLLERHLIKEHIDNIGYKPAGNIKDESHMDNKGCITDKMFASIFEME